MQERTRGQTAGKAIAHFFFPFFSSMYLADTSTGPMKTAHVAGRKGAMQGFMGGLITSIVLIVTSAFVSPLAKFLSGAHFLALGGMPIFITAIWFFTYMGKGIGFSRGMDTASMSYSRWDAFVYAFTGDAFFPDVSQAQATALQQGSAPATGYGHIRPRLEEKFDISQMTALNPAQKSAQLLDAAKTGHLAKFQALLEAGANINSVDHTNKNVFHMACMEGQENIVSYLLEQSSQNTSILALLNAYNNVGNTPLLLAIHHNHTSTVQKLVAHPHADVNQQNSPQPDARLTPRVTPLMLACGTMENATRSFRDIRIVETLLSVSPPRTVDVNQALYDGSSTALSRAADCKNVEAVRRLLAHRGIDAIRNGAERGAQLAAQHKDTETKALFAAHFQQIGAYPEDVKHGASLPPKSINYGAEKDAVFQILASSKIIIQARNKTTTVLSMPKADDEQKRAFCTQLENLFRKLNWDGRYSDGHSGPKASVIQEFIAIFHIPLEHLYQALDLPLPENCPDVVDGRITIKNIGGHKSASVDPTVASDGIINHVIARS